MASTAKEHSCTRRSGSPLTNRSRPFDSDAEQAEDALKSDWEQTKADIPGDAGQDKDQDVDDTLRQAAGKQSTEETS